jgi:hypothetical protein
MAATSQLLANYGRIAGPHGNVSVIPVIITATATAYATATGGLPVDLTSVLQQAAPYELDFLNPGDIIGVYSVGPSANGFMPGPLIIGTPTYTAKPLASSHRPTHRVGRKRPSCISAAGRHPDQRSAN